MAIIDFEFETLKKDFKNLTIEDLEKILFDFGLEIESYNKDTDLLKIEVTAERTDLLSFEGFKKALKAYLSLEKYTPFSLKNSNQKIFVKQSAIDYGNYTMCAIIKNLSLDSNKIKEIINIQEKLHLTYGRKRKSVAIGIYPLDKITFPISFQANSSEEIKFRPLGEKNEMTGQEIIDKTQIGKEYSHLLKNKQKFLCFKDANKNILSMPPIINSDEIGKVTEETKDIFLECTGPNLFKLKNIINILTTLFADYKGEIYSLEIIYPNKKIISPDITEKKITCSLKSINKTIGLNFKKEEVKSLLEKMMYNNVVFKDKDLIEVSVPIVRTDVMHENDIADDLSRAYTFEKIPPTYTPVNFTAERLKISITQEEIINTMVSMGFIEILPFTLTSIKDNFTNFNLKAEKFIPLGFSAESSINMVGNWLTPKLFKALINNQHKRFPQKIFACDYVVIENKKKDTLSENKLSVAALISNSKISFTEICSNLLSLTKVFGKEIEIIEKNYPFYIKGRSGKIMLDKKDIGHIGEFSVDVLKKHEYSMPVCGFEIDAEVLF